jgi:hypothetical protein
MRSWRVIVVVVVVAAAAGCEAVFEVSPVRATDAAIDGPALPRMVTGHLRLDYSMNDSGFVPVVASQIFPAAQVTLAIVHDDGSTTPATYDDTTGAFTFVAPAPYRLRVATPFGHGDLELAASSLELVDRIAGRPTRTPVTLPTTIVFQLGMATGTAVIYTTGLWTQTTTNVVDTGDFSFRWDGATSVSGPLGLIDASQRDVVYIAEVTTLVADGRAYTAITELAASAGVTLTDGSTYTLPGGMTAEPGSQCVHVISVMGTEQQRITSALPNSYIQSNANWQLSAVPSQAQGPVGAMWVAILAQQGSLTDVDMKPSFFNPFPGDLLASINVSDDFMIQLPGATPATVSVATTTYLPATQTALATCPGNFVFLQPSIALAGSPTIGATRLTTDGQSVPLDLSRSIPITWGLAAAGPVDYTSIKVFEVAKEGSPLATTLHDVGVIITPTSSAHVDASWFVPGNAYVLQFATHTGVPNAASGDFATLAYPRADGVSWSHYFVVQRG